MAPRHISAAQLAEVLEPGGLTLVSSCSAESSVLAQAVKAAGDRLGNMCFSGVFVSGLNKETFLHSQDAEVLTFFLTPDLKRAQHPVHFLPLCYNDILKHLQKLKPSAALVMLSPPDDNGRCSFGTEYSFPADLWDQIPIKIAHINPNMPFTRGKPGPRFDELTAYIEQEQTLLTTSDPMPDEKTKSIALNVAQYIQDGNTIQTGLGKIPGAVLRAVADRMNLKLHTGLVGDAALDLIESGALTGKDCATVGAAIGSQCLYDNLTREQFNFQSVDVTHNANLMAQIDGFVSINSAFEVDLFGQAYAERGSSGLASGPGGASDFATGAKNAGGLRVVALPSSFGRDFIQSRIISPGQTKGPVSLGRMDIDVVVTEFGAAELSGKSHQERARALIAISEPALRDNLEQQWLQYFKETL